MTRSHAVLTTATVAFGLALVACTDAPLPTAAPVPLAELDRPVQPGRHLEVVLFGTGSGRIRFRQPVDEVFIAFLDTRVFGLAPFSAYRLQRAVDAVVDNNCTGQAWLTLGNLTLPLLIQTGEGGVGNALFRRDLSASAGLQFDIHFRVIDAAGAVVLTSGCYQFKVSP